MQAAITLLRSAARRPLTRLPTLQTNAISHSLQRSSVSARIADTGAGTPERETAFACQPTRLCAGPSLGLSTVSTPTRAFSSGVPDIETQRARLAKDLEKLPEMVQARKFAQWLEQGAVDPVSEEQIAALRATGLTEEKIMKIVQAAFSTFLVHVESRAASAMQHGFYTIGPCGEELMAAMALAFKPTDAVALHYRHVATQIMRQLLAGKDLDAILLDRARAHTVSETDPVTGGAHCAIGGGPYDFLVTSTLASQACPAVGRAMGSGLSHFLASAPKAKGMTPLFPKDMVSFVSVGDGSVNNAHFLSAVNLAEYASHRKFRCPIVFTVTDNDLCISLRGYEWVRKTFLKKLQMPMFEASGTDFVSIYTAHEKAAAYARSRGAPAFVYVGGIKRRFGHAATDRQNAYLTPQEIQALADSNCLASLVNTVVGANIASVQEISALYQDLWARTKEAFTKASREEKIVERASSLRRTSVPLTTLPESAKVASNVYGPTSSSSGNKIHSYVTGPVTSTSLPDYLGQPIPDSERGKGSRWYNIQTDVSTSIGAPRLADIPEAVPLPAMPRDVMRKHMTRVFDELLTAYPQMVYIGEDVVHGGYYLVTEQLATKYPQRVRDFPPDETSLIGAGVGFAQTGMLPVVEIPYAKYLDCGADMFFEAALMCWLSNGKQPNGMIIRLQGFGRGVFGGNFHTHNSLHLPAGIDVVCYSNGQDYAMGMRYAALQASRGRIVMSVDSTHLLNLRHVDGEDDAWRMTFTAPDEFLPFEQVRVYKPQPESSRNADSVAIVTYGEGVVTALQARKRLASEFGVTDVTIIDSPLLSSVPQGLKDELASFSRVLFADPCKQRLAPLASHVTALQAEGLLPAKWRLAAAQNTYNPLGNTTTFLSPADIVYEVLHVADRAVDEAAEKRERA